MSTLSTALSEASTAELVDLVLEGRVEIGRLRVMVEALRDSDPCEFDHHGYCQAHGWMTTDKPCPHGLAAEMFNNKHGDSDDSR